MNILLIDTNSSSGSSNEDGMKGFPDRLDEREMEGSRITEGVIQEQKGWSSHYLLTDRASLRCDHFNF